MGLDCMLVPNQLVIRRKNRGEATNLDLEDTESIHPRNESWQCGFTGSADTNQQQVALWMTRWKIKLAEEQPSNTVHFTDTTAILNSIVLKRIVSVEWTTFLFVFYRYLHIVRINLVLNF